MLYVLSSILTLLILDSVWCSDLDDCGFIFPSVRKYIYGGRSAFIEQWPWQVIVKKIFLKILFKK